MTADPAAGSAPVVSAAVATLAAGDGGAVARTGDIEHLNTQYVWYVVKTQECRDKTGGPPIATTWVNVNKGDQQEYDVIGRLVAREMGGAKSDEFYAPTPPRGLSVTL